MSLQSPSSRDYNRTGLAAQPIARLRVRPAPCHGESLRGYLLRLTSDNGYDTIRWLAWLEPVLRKITQETVAIEAIKRLTGFSDIETHLLSPFGKKMLPGHFRAPNPRICPACLKEKGYHDAVWEIAFACTCPHHGIMLVDSCSRCRAPLSWSQPSVTCCNCGASLIDVGTAEAEPDLQYLNAKIWTASGREVQIINSDGFPDEELSRLSLKQLCQLFLFVAAHENGTISMKRAKPTNVAAAAIALNVVSSALSDWPYSFKRFLANHCNNKWKFNGEGLQQVFGDLYIRLYKHLVGEEFSFIRNAFEAFIGDNWFGVISRTHKRVNRDKIHNDATNLRSAAKTLKIGSRSLRRLVEKELVKGRVIRRTSGRCRIMVSEKDTARFRDQVGSGLDGKKTRELLGISRKQFYMLVEEGFLDPLLRPGEEGCGKWWFDYGTVRELLHKVMIAAPQQEPGTDAISFRDVCQWHIFCSEQFSAFFTALLNGAIAVAGVKSNSEFTLASMYFSPETIAEFKAGLKIRPADDYSIPEVAIRLGVKEEVVYHLVNSGLMASHCDASKRFKGRMVSEANVKAFEDEFISLAQLARLQETSPRALKKKNDAVGLSATTGRDIDGCRQIFYRRVDLS